MEKLMVNERQLHKAAVGFLSVGADPTDEVTPHLHHWVFQLSRSNQINAIALYKL
jgi:hypothetical protein